MNNIPWHLARPCISLRHTGLNPTTWPRIQTFHQIQAGLPPQPRSYFNHHRRSSIISLQGLVQALPFSTEMPGDKGAASSSSAQGVDAESPREQDDKQADGSSSSSMKRQRHSRHGYYTRSAPRPKKSRGNDHYQHKKLKWIKREWVPLGDASQHPGGLDFSFMSYNVLAQELLERHKDMYDHCDNSLLNWEYRRKKLVKEIENYRPDVICMQEVQVDHYYNFYGPKMKHLGYEGVYKKRTHEKEDGCATFFNEKKFAMDVALPVEYFHSKIRILDRDNVGLVVLLKPIVPHASPRKGKPPSQPETSETRLCVANTHLLFNPRRGDVKLAQLCLLLAEIDKIAMKPDSSGYHPVILAGDFNFLPHCPLYDFLLGKGLDLKLYSGQDLSRQEESKRGKVVALNHNQLPPRVGIFDQCQYMHEVSRRWAVRKALAAERKSEKDSGANEKGKAEKSKSSKSSGDIQKNTLGTGVISNSLNLLSVYGSEALRDGKMCPVISTKHGRSECMVDFVFYTVDKKLPGVDHVGNKKLKHLVEEGNLKLLTRLDLYSRAEARKIGGFPNREYPSDHIPLMADFRLCF